MALKATGQTYSDMIDLADKAIASQDWTTAESSLVDAMRIDPSNPANVMLLSNLGMIQYYQGKDIEAINTLTDAHRMAPSSIVVLANRARVLTSINDINHALADYDLINKLDSTAWQPYHYRGLIYLALGDIDAAKENITSLQKIRPDATETALSTALLLIEQDRLVDAIPYLDVLIARDPQADYYAARALCNIRREYYTDAADDIVSGINIDPDNYKLYEARAMLNRKLYQNDRSLEDAQRAINLGADPRRIKNLLGI